MGSTETYQTKYLEQLSQPVQKRGLMQGNQGNFR